MTQSRHEAAGRDARQHQAGGGAAQRQQAQDVPAGQVFDPEELQALGDAFQKSLQSVAPPPWAERQPGADHYAKEAVAKVILGVARTGERDPEVIAAAAVDRLTI